MFRQKQTPRGSNHLPKMFRKCEAKTTGEHPYRRVIPTKLHMQLYWNHPPPPATHTHTHRLPHASRLHTYKTLSQKNIFRGLLLIFNLKVKFCQKKLIKSKNSWDHWYLDIFLWLTTNDLWRNMCRYPCELHMEPERPSLKTEN